MAIFGYKKVFKYYDSERRERQGYYEGKPDSSTARGYDFTNAYMQQFNIDVTDLPKTVQLLELSNGITFNIELLSLRQQTSTYKRLLFRVFYNDANGQLISSISMAPGYETQVLIHNDGIIDDKIQVYPGLVIPNYAYNTTQGAVPASIYTGTLIFRNYSETSLYPQLNQFYTSDFLVYGTNPYYVVHNSKTFYNENDWTEQWLNVIKNGGDGTPITPILPSEDTSGQGGGDSAEPDYNPFSDPINFPNLPTITALSSGMISAYNPTNSMLAQLGQKLWSTNVIEELKKIWNDPMEGIISLHLMPFTPPVYGSKECKIGSYNTEIVMPTIISQFVQKYCGTIKVSERFASALDYSPYTTAYIHMPFVGIVPLDIDYIMNKTLDLRYQIDVLTGNGVAMLSCDGAILYEFPCNLAMSIPLTSVNHGALYRNIIDVAGNAGHAIVAGATGSGASAVANGAVRTLESALDTIASKASEVQKSGAITGGAGMLDVFEAYLIFHRPMQSLASDFNHFKGYPCNITYTLSELSGYTEVEYAHLEGVTATDEEKDEIQTLLQTGVIL